MALTSIQIEDAQFIRETMGWPYWPFLPIKRERQCGTLMDTGDGIRGIQTVLLANLFAYCEMSDEEAKAVERKQYASLEEFFADGWYVD